MKKTVSLILSLVILFSLCACSQQKSEMYKKDFLDLFDTASSVSAYDSSQEMFNEHFSAVYDELSEYSKLFDIYNSYEDVVNLKYINENAAKVPVKADERIIELLLWGKEAYELSGGMVNIAMGSVLGEWHTAMEAASENPENAALPDSKVLSQKAEHCDIDDLVIDEENSTVFFADSEMSLNVGAIAKGFVCDKIADFITENGIWSSAVINLGGNIKTVGFKYEDGKTPFSIGVENPNGGYLNVLSVSNGQSVVTSGDYQRYFTVNGKNYCHIINPETLMPSEYVTSVTVICENSALADTLSTALFNMSVEDGLKFIENFEGTEAVWLDKNGKTTCSPGYTEFVNQ